LLRVLPILRVFAVQKVLVLKDAKRFIIIYRRITYTILTKILQYPPGGDKIKKKDRTKINYFIERYVLRKGTLDSFHIDFIARRR